MSLNVLVFLFIAYLLLSLTLLWRLDWYCLRSSSAPGGAKRSTFLRLRHRLAPQTTAQPVVSPPLPRRS